MSTPNLLYLAGKESNVLYDAELVELYAGSADSKYPLANVYDSIAGSRGKFSADAGFRADLNRVLNGDLEDFGALGPEHWTCADVSVVTEENTIVLEGTASCRIEGIASDNSVKQQIKVLPGQRLKVHAAARTSFSGEKAKIFIQNIHTSHYLNASTGQWGSAIVFVEAATSGSWVQSGTVSTTIEAFALSNQWWNTLEITLLFDGITAGRYGYFDDIALWPEIDFVSVHGHTILPAFEPEVLQGDSNVYASAVSVTFLTPKQPTFFKKLTTATTKRWLFLDLTRGDGEWTYLGEFVVGQYQTFGQLFRDRWRMTHKMPGTRNEAVSGQVSFRAANDYEQRKFDAEFFHKSVTAAKEVQEIFTRSRWGNESVVLCLDTEDWVLMGKLKNEFDYDYQGSASGQLVTSRVELLEDPLGLTIA